MAVGHPHEALAAQHCLDRAIPCSWGLPLQGTVGGHWQPAQYHLSQSAVQQSEPLNSDKLPANYKQLKQAGYLMCKVLQMTEDAKHAIDCCQKHCLPQSKSHEQRRLSSLMRPTISQMSDVVSLHKT